MLDKKNTTSPISKKPTEALTKVGAVLGTPLYMSPEQCRGENLTKSSDIYSLAVIVYQMFSGKTPFEGNYHSVMESHKNEDPPPIHKIAIPNKLKKTVMQSLAKNPEERSETAESFAIKLRANSEGLGVLLRKSVIVYSKRLPKLLLLSFLTFLPVFVIIFVKISVILFLEVNEMTSFTPTAKNSISALHFILNIVTAAFLVGTTTWVVAQTVAFPLRPISLKAAFNEIKKKWKPLLLTVPASTILAILSWLAGGLIGGLGFLTSSFALVFLIDNTASIIFLALSVLAGVILFGVTTTCLFMLITPSIMMEGVGGVKAFRRSIRLAKRSFKTVFAAVLIVYVVPFILAVFMGTSINSIISNVEMQNEMQQMKIEGVKPMSEEELEVQYEPKKDENTETGFARRMSGVLRGGLFEIIWTPIALLITSITSVVIASIYFKTRQAGGESMSDLLSKLDNVDENQSKWQKRVREKLIQSGRISARTSKSS